MESPGRVIADRKVTRPWPRGLNDTTLAGMAADISACLQKASQIINRFNDDYV